MVITLREGDRNQHVRMLQKSLNQQGANLYVDGVFGPATEAAVLAFQKAQNLIPDGICGRQTFLALSGQRDPKSLTANAIEQAAKRLELPEATILAITEVEAGGDGFLPNGKPDILFERHVMYQQLCDIRKEGETEAERIAYVDALTESSPNLVNSRPGGYAGGTAEHGRLSLAKSIDHHCALCSASWGMFQIMGYHFQRLGYASPQAYVDHISTGEDAQLEAFCAFIETDPDLHKALKVKKWAQFAKIYNGPGYKRYHYDTRIAEAFRRYCEAEKTLPNTAMEKSA